jgi:ABC-type multidrug transport system ATPase subunit
MFSYSLLLLAIISILQKESVFGFAPALSTNCSLALGALSVALEPQTCGYVMKYVVQSSANFSECTSGRDGVNCFDPGSVYQAAQASKKMVPVYRIANQSACSLCTAKNGMKAGCSSLLNTLVSVSYGGSVDFTTYNLTTGVTKSEVNVKAAAVRNYCKSFGDQSSLQVFKYQSELLCESSNTFNYPVTPTGTIDGVLDMRSLMQCGTCAVIPCLPGQLCDGNGKAEMCPEGYYCPTTAAKVTCPKGYFCPEGSTEPKQCRGVAGSSCEDEGNTREVVWIPLFIALILMIVIGSAEPVRDFVSSAKSTVISRVFHVVAAQEDDEMEFSTRTSEVAISFNDLVLITNKTVRLNHVSGHIRPGKFTAIMGGSGAGKTTLMNAILGREAVTSGEISYQSKDYPGGKIPARILDRIVAFVPQNDVYLREMTVYELVEHSARWRGTVDMTKEIIDARIEEVLTQLQLQHLRNTPVGEGLSPGDRKKVNIALELVSSPNVLFLDEPTTGIDASSALNIARIISNLAKTGLTCVAVIHQPRAEIFELIDDIIILSQGGRMAYQGNTKFVLPYFSNLGYTVDSDPKVNKTDFLIDITSKPPRAEVLALPSPYTNADEMTASGGKKAMISLEIDSATPSQREHEHGIAVAKAMVAADTATTQKASPTQPSPTNSFNENKITWADLWTRDEKVSSNFFACIWFIHNFVLSTILGISTKV